MMVPNYPEIAQRVFNTPLMVEPRKAAAFLKGLGPRLLSIEPGQVSLAMEGKDACAPAWSPPAFASLLGDDVANSIRDGYRDGYAVVDGAAIIPVRGVLIHRGAWVGQSSGQTSYEGLRAQIDTALEDDRVHGIALEVDSFGGEVAGCFDLADHIRWARGIKPIYAFVAEHSYSAAYALASQADRIIVSRTGGTGSVGVVCMHVDVSAAMADEKVKITLIHAGKHKVDGNPYEPLPEAVRDDWTAEMEDLRMLFAQTVAAGREQISTEAVIATEARQFTAPESITVGFADEINEPRAAFQAFTKQLQSGASRTKSVAATAQITGEPVMAKRNSAKLMPGDAPTPDDLTDNPEDDQEEDVTPEVPDPEPVDDDGDPQEDDPEDPEGAGDDDPEADKTGPGKSPAAKRERQRIAGILNSKEGKANQRLAKHLAFNTGHSTASSRKMLSAAGPSASNSGRLSRAMHGENPSLQAGDNEPGKGLSSADLMRKKYPKN